MSKQLRIMSIVGARPNFVKIAPLVRAIETHGDGIVHRLVHTGQHYDAQMSQAFFDDLALPRPDIDLEVGSGSHAEQTGRVMMAIEPVLAEFKPDIMVVVGDVNSTLACALTAKKMGVAVAHVEAGLRSFDMTMPEEINRICTDAISDMLFTTDRLANANLANEGVAEDRVHFVGNVMIDSLLRHLDRAKEMRTAQSLGLSQGKYATLTLHRPANVDHEDKLEEILTAVADGVGDLPVVFPVHPRTRLCVERFGLGGQAGFHMIEPLGYLKFLDLNAGAALAVTDSGGVQEETTILGVPCVTVRENTERPITLSEGTNHLAGVGRPGILAAIGAALSADRNCGSPEKWDGKAGSRIVSMIVERMSGN